MVKIISAEKPFTENGKTYHVRASPKEVGRYVLLPGNPDRVKLIACKLDNHHIISEHREFTVYDGYIENELVTVCSTGIGGPATAIVVEELASSGAKVFIRVGSCGAIQEFIRPGDTILVTSSVRLDGTSKQYVMPEYPAVASYDVMKALEKAAKKVGGKYHIGIAASTDSFYVGQSRPGFKEYLPCSSRELIDVLRRANVLCFEMESSTLFTVSNIYGLKAGCVLSVFANRIKNIFEVKGEAEAADIAVETIRFLVRDKI
ncbi:MAG: nucleoside phosphorylase [Nitrososphaeria archaeon]